MEQTIIILTHSTLSEGFKNTLLFFDSSKKNVHAICAYTEGVDFKADLNGIIAESQTESIVILTDMLGGSVNQYVTKLGVENNKIKIVTGINFPFLLELALTEDKLTDEKIREVVNKSKEQIIFVNDYIRGEFNEEGGLE